MSDAAQIEALVDQWRQERPDLEVGPMAVIGKIRRLSDRLRASLVAGYAEYGIGEGEFDVLSVLRRAGAPYEILPSRLADYTMVTAGATTKRIDRLIDAGLVDRRLSDGDRRCRMIALTPAGLALIDEAITAHAHNERRIAEALTPDELAQLEHLASKWLEAWSSERDAESE